MRTLSRVLAAAAILWLCTGQPAFAGYADIADAAHRTTDQSRQALVMIFGSVVNNPLAVAGGSGDTLLAGIFQVLNATLLVIGAVIVVFHMIKKIKRTAHDGEYFDRERNGAWGPIRLVWGLAILVPTPNGWSLAQLLMLWAASVMGVGTANLGTDAAVAMLADGTGMVVQPVVPSTANLARGLFEVNLCMHAINSGLAQAEAAGALETRSGYVQQQPTDSGFVLRNSSFVCGGADVNADLAAQPRSTGLFSATIDTSDLRRAHLEALRQMQQTLNPEANAFVDAYVMSRQNGARLPDVEQVIQSAARQYEAYIQSNAATRQGNVAELSAQISSALQESGWLTLGAWYQTFAQANTKLSDAVAAKASVFGSSSEGDPAVVAIYQPVMAAFKVQQTAASLTGPLGATPSSGTKAAAAGDSNQIIAALFKAPGQKLVNYMIDINAGGGARGQINPLIKMKNVGDYTMATVEGALATYVVAKALSDGKEDKWSVPGLLNPVTKIFSSIGESLKGAMTTMEPYVFMAVAALFMLGATLSNYIPMVPFIIWFSNAVNYFVVVGEAVIAASLWAITFFLSEGEGVGHKSGHGLIFLLNVMLRPILMVSGFFLGGALMVAGGTLLNLLYGVALANAQFDSMTGLVSVIFYLAIYCSLCLNLVHRSFNLISIVPDQVINWIGGHAAAKLGREEHDQVHNMVQVLATRMEQMKTGNFGGQRKGGDKGDGLRA